jgi:hypothetical protein
MAKKSTTRVSQPAVNTRKGAGSVRTKAASGKTAGIRVVSMDEMLIQKFNSMSRAEAGKAVRRAGIVTPAGRLSSVFK